MPRELHTWKDVANYLGVSVRTAQLWESQRGLPVRRLPGEKARILAIPDEIDAWKVGHPQPAPSSQPWGLVAAALTAGLVIGAAATWLSLRPVPLDHFTVLNGVLQAFDSAGRPAWSREIGGRMRAQDERWFAPAEKVDLDGDGIPEIVAIDHTGKGSHSVICIDARGNLRWRRELGQTINTIRTYEPPYHSRGLQVLTGFPDNKPRILATAFHHTFHPFQVLLLDGAGGVEGNFWHSGHLASFALFDWNNDGSPELLAGGINQAARTAELLILNPKRMTGTSEAGVADFQIRGMAEGVELERALFKRAPLNTSSEPYNVVHEILPKQQSIVIGVDEAQTLVGVSRVLHYEIDRQRQVLAVSPSDQYRVGHAAAVRAGRPAGPLTSDELRDALPLRWIKPNRPSPQ